MFDQDRAKVFNYDVFISYKSEESSWARRLAETLRGFGLKVWRDHDAIDGIRVAEEWSVVDNLSGGLCKSTDLDAVHERLVPFCVAGFQALCNGKPPGPRRPRRKK